MTRVYNFSAGPAVLPESVLKKAAAELFEYNGTGMSIMEMSHRSDAYQAVIDETESLLRGLMNIPSNYKVLFLQGGASLQFAMVPMNMPRRSGKIDIVHTGTWTKRAIDEAKKFRTVNVLASSEDKKFTYIPKVDKSALSADADYYHLCTNNTIEGTKFSPLPDTGDVPIVADMSSNILSEVYDVNKFAVIFAGAQKNIGPAGLTIVIIRDDYIGHADEKVPTMLNYKTHADNGSMYNTPPTYGIYMAKLVFEWLKGLGGVPAMQKLNEEKASILYNYLDESKLFASPVAAADRSLMNIPFTASTKELEARFLKEANSSGLVTLEGHRSVGGMRASIYNAMPVEGVKKLVEFMKQFETDNR